MSRKFSGVINVAEGTIGGSKTLFKNAAKHADMDLIKRFDGMDFDELRNFDVGDPRRVDANALLKAEKKMSFTGRAKTGVKKAATACGKSPGLCAGAGITGYLAYASYKDLSKEKKQCSNICMPDDWDEFKNGRKARPTYKTENAVSPYDPSMKYEALYPENADIVCTTANMMQDGINPAQKDSCDKFCQNVCDFTLDEVITNVPAKGASIFMDAINKMFESVFGDGAKWAMLASGVMSFLIPILVIIVVLKK